jgi:two-component system nitrogen regulation response regulator NtrX
VAINCAALTETLLESELFGHERGAFTGAIAQKKGRLELADGGTFFFDEIGELAPALQSKLLRVLQQREFERVGGTRPIAVDIRLISASNLNLAAEVRAGRFREDLFFRLNVIPLNVPPLRERPSDIPLLVKHFTALHRARTGQAPPAWSPDALSALTRYRWPGNVRELANIVERLSILNAGGAVGEDAIRAVLPVERSVTAAPLPDPAALEHSLTDTLDEYERTLIARALSMADGNVAEAARRLKTDRPNLYRRMRRLGIGTAEEMKS